MSRDLRASETFARRVKQQRERLGWTMRQLAEASGVPPAAINDIENDRRRRGVTIDELMLLAAALGCPDPAELLPAIEAATSPPPRPQFMDNPKACGAPPNARWGYLPCGCENDGFGNHASHKR